MSGDPLALVVYAGQMATYVCEGGDVQPTYPILNSITEEVLRLLRQEQCQTTAPDQSAPASASSAMHTSGDRTWLLKQQAQELRYHFLPLLLGRFVLLVVPLSSTASYREEWTRLCFDSHVRARRLVMLTDTVASAFACGMDSGVVVHASLSTVSMCRVEEGCSTRYSNSQMGSLQMLCGVKLSLQLAEEWPKVANSVTTSNSTSVPALGPVKGAEVDTAVEGDADKHLWSSGGGALVDLKNPAYRDTLVRAFGFKAYRDVIVRAQMEAQQHQAAMTTSSKGKGKGGTRQRAPSLLDDLHQKYPRRVRRAPGQLEKLLARVVQDGPTTPASAAFLEGGEPCVLAGEALAIPYVHALFDYLVKRCGDDVWAVVERERRARKRSLTSSRSQHRSSPSHHDHRDTMRKAESGAAHSGANGGSDEAATGTRLHNSSTSRSTSSGKDLSDEEEEEEEESSFSSSSSYSSSGTSLPDRSDEDTWLRLQPTPLPAAPWWLPLLGGSIVSRLTDKDLQRAVITAEEARETNGTMVHWRMLL
ncbi:conserved hypothetical protein [Leishmania infantum JPCM5]|uniref:Uncharacterized protein n=2 Tax=Leishmania infantum TaxID=5671 RepID=A4I5I9_LEIIN|nr:conserved hypothetical protein [Leishmania infantum JPCM5]CAC9513584.1 hypothetical_protein_-_conserved [Leishmania infantum]CAM70059.1 conserved hypothetical protein [Leishmania infantum JPCM5]SUZ43977.1 hypothetical_protein_-_conserved [Leishmania infantum]|eukprot:XP_001467008.1 conserved hypothetical protein [Leishmania infantum JPCM5]